MPLTHPLSKVLCPFCFREFHLGQAPLRVISSSVRVNDPVVQRFLSKESDVPMAPVEQPTGFFNKALRWFWYPSLTDDNEVKHRICPHCHMELPVQLANNKLRSNIIAVTGYRSSGKSNFFGVLIDALRNRYSEEVGLNLTTQETFSTRSLQTIYSDELYDERYGDDLFGDNPKAVKATLSAESNIDIRIPLIYRLNLTRFSFKQRLLHPFATHRPIDLVLFDAAGEDLKSPDIQAIHGRYLSHAAGIIALIDPLSYSEIRKDIRMNTNITSNQKPFDAMAILRRTIEKHSQLSPNQKIKVPLAVTISKFDLLRNAPGLDPCVFEDHVHSNGFDELAAKKTSDAIRSYITHKGINAITSVAEGNFQTCQYFGMSALGRSPREDSSLTSIDPINIADSLLWILNRLGYLQTEEEMKGRSKRGNSRS
ncbi:MAG: hypothetical protein IJQ39_07460 [Thermoguttaceae bacterium]|nr:hypothetical protein [Thermoguttaceae bacterium]